MVKRHYDESELLDYVELDPKTETLVDKTILLHFDSFCLGDTICFASLIEPFIDFHKPKKVLGTLGSPTPKKVLGTQESQGTQGQVCGGSSNW